MPMTIGPGATGDDVRQVQERPWRGNCCGIRSGQLLAYSMLPWKRRSSCSSQANGLSATGTVDGPTWAKLPAYQQASPTVRIGDTGPDRRLAMQQALQGQDIGILFTPYAGAIDGIFGPLTETSVRALGKPGQAPRRMVS